MEIIDAHTNLRYPGERIQGDDSLWPTFESRLAVLRGAGITHALACRNESVKDRTADELLAWNGRIAEACEASGGMLIAAAIIQPALGEPACELLRRCREELDMRFVGEMFDRSLGYQWGSPQYYDVLACAVELRMVPLIHCEDEAIPELGDRYPAGKFMIAHLCAQSRLGGFDHRFAAMAPYRNLSLVVSGREIAWPGAVSKAARLLGAERVIFGSDLGAVDPGVAVQCVRRSGLDESEQALVLAANFRTLWRWTDSG